MKRTACRRQCDGVGEGDAVGGEGERCLDTGCYVPGDVHAADGHLFDNFFADTHRSIVEVSGAYAQQRVILRGSNGNVVYVKPIVLPVVAEGQLDGLADIIRQRYLHGNIHRAVGIIGGAGKQLGGEVLYVVASGGHIYGELLVHNIVSFVFDVKGEDRSV